MTISRCEVLALCLFLAACGISNYPDAASPLGRIVRIKNFADQSAQLKRYVEQRLDRRDELRAQFAEAGFTSSKFVDEQGRACEDFGWEGHGGLFQDVAEVSVCGRSVNASSGERAL